MDGVFYDDEVGPDEGNENAKSSYHLTRHFSIEQRSEIGEAKGIRAPELLHAMQHGFVRRRRAGSGYRRSSGSWCPGTSRCGWRDLGALALGLALDLRTPSRGRSQYAKGLAVSLPGL